MTTNTSPLFALIVFLAAPLISLAGDPVHLFLLSGQSNMANMKPDQVFTPEIERHFGAEKVVVVKVAQKGQPIRRWYKGWKVTGDQNPDEIGDIDERLMEATKAAISGKSIKSVTLVWMQGERDASPLCCWRRWPRCTLLRRSPTCIGVGPARSHHTLQEISIRDCIVHDCPNGIMSSDHASGNLTVEYCEVFHCGRGQGEHQFYIATDEEKRPGSVFRLRFCYIHDGTGGHNVKSRAERTMVYGNWISNAFYHNLELIGADPAGGVRADRAREDGEVVGNVLIASRFGRNVRVGGDGTGQSNGRYRFLNNTFIYGQILPAQLEDGFWHYSLQDKDPKDKDVLGYFMLTIEELMKLQKFNPAYREEKLTAALRKAQAFALKHIAPMTDPNTGTATTEHATRGTPKHYAIEDEAKRSFQLGLVLIGGGHLDEGIKIMTTALDHFPIGNGGQDGAHAAEPSALILSGF